MDKFIGDKNSDNAGYIAVDSNSSVYVTYTNAKPATVTVFGGVISTQYLLSFKADGTQQWSKNFASTPWYDLSYYTSPAALEIDAANRIFIAGTRGKSSNEIFIQEYSTTASDKGLYILSNTHTTMISDLVIDRTNGKFSLFGSAFTNDTAKQNYGLPTLDLCIVNIQAL